ncbi:MAG: hypothetical protein U9P12_07350, partial [Verrucomicrobiota bacterium]|nr:hypothetical protein [Verrucomicrobiota bacterium]
ELLLANKQRKKIKPAIFVEKDQDFITDWAKLAGFRSPSFFKIECKKDLVEKWKDTEEAEVHYSNGGVDTETISETKFERVIYEIYLENRNDVPLSNLKFEYRIFYEQSVNADQAGKLSTSRNNKNGELKVNRLSPKAKMVLKTEAVVIHEKEYVGEITSGGSNFAKESGEIKGVWIKIHTKTASGETVTRDVYEPEKIKGKYVW